MSNHKLQKRDYLCPSCNTHLSTETNHIGEIYTQCKKCSCSTLYCVEEEAIKARNERPQSRAVIKKYRFNTSNENEFNSYRDLLKKIDSLSHLGNFYTLFDTLAKPFVRPYHEFIDNDSTLIIYDKELFDNQFISNRGRVHLWAEEIYDNRNIKSGYYLILDNTINSSPLEED